MLFVQPALLLRRMSRWFQAIPPSTPVLREGYTQLAGGQPGRSIGVTLPRALPLPVAWIFAGSLMMVVTMLKSPAGSARWWWTAASGPLAHSGGYSGQVLVGIDIALSPCIGRFLKYIHASARILPSMLWRDLGPH